MFAVIPARQQRRQRPFTRHTPLYREVRPLVFRHRPFWKFCARVQNRRFPRRLFTPSPSMWSTTVPAAAPKTRRCINTVRPPTYAAAYVFFPPPTGRHLYRATRSYSPSSTSAKRPSVSSTLTIAPPLQG